MWPGIRSKEKSFRIEDLLRRDGYSEEAAEEITSDNPSNPPKKEACISGNISILNSPTKPNKNAGKNETTTSSRSPRKCNNANEPLSNNRYGSRGSTTPFLDVSDSDPVAAWAVVNARAKERLMQSDKSDLNKKSDAEDLCGSKYVTVTSTRYLDTSDPVAAWAVLTAREKERLKQVNKSDGSTEPDTTGDFFTLDLSTSAVLRAHGNMYNDRVLEQLDKISNSRSNIHHRPQQLARNGPSQEETYDYRFGGNLPRPPLNFDFIHQRSDLNRGFECGSGPYTIPSALPTMGISENLRFLPSYGSPTILGAPNYFAESSRLPWYLDMQHLPQPHPLIPRRPDLTVHHNPYENGQQNGHEHLPPAQGLTDVLHFSEHMNHLPTPTWHPPGHEDSTLLNLTSKRKGGQIRFTNYQTALLEKAFSGRKYLNAIERKRLADSLILTDRQVKTWFQNRRAKWRKTKDGNSSPLPDSKVS